MKERLTSNLPLILSLFLATNLLLYYFINTFHASIRLNTFNYKTNAYKLLEDQRINGGAFHLLRALGQYDAQWYLKIATEGYPFTPNLQVGNQKDILNGLSYAFFPLYPFLLATINLPIKNIEVTAFFVSNVFLLLNFISLYITLSSYFSKSLALKTILLLFFFPFSIFYRSYYAEGLFLFLLIWFVYFLKQRFFFKTAVTLSLLLVTKGNSFLLYFLYLYYLLKHQKRKKTHSWLRITLLALLPLVLLSLWMLYCYQQTGNAFYFMSARQTWSSSGLSALLLNILQFLKTPFLPAHSFHESQLDNIMLLVTFIILLKSKMFLPKELWWTSALLIFVHLIGQDLMSYSRNQSFSFPLFLYLAHVLDAKWYFFVLCIFILLFLLVSLLFVNWYWIG